MTLAYRLAFTASAARAFAPRGAPARWNLRGVPVVYTAEHPALAALEILSAWQDYDDLDGYHLYRVRLAANGVRDALEDDPRLDPGDVGAARAYGTAWTRSASSVALRVPSVVAPESFNYLLNPDHPAFDRIVSYEAICPFRYDARVRTLIERGKRDEGA